MKVLIKYAAIVGSRVDERPLNLEYSSVPELRPFSLCEGCSSLLTPVLSVIYLAGTFRLNPLGLFIPYGGGAQSAPFAVDAGVRAAASRLPERTTTTKVGTGDFGADLGGGGDF